MTSGFFEGIAALSADAAIVFTCLFAALAAAAAGFGLYTLKVGHKANALRLLTLSVAVSFGAWLIYGLYQELVVKANGVATGPIYEALVLGILMSMPLVLLLSMMFYSPSEATK